MINYTKRDYFDIKQELLDIIPRYTDAWTDFSSTDLGMIFLEFIAGTTAMLNYYIDKEVSETRIMQATEPRNIFSNLELIGYKRPLKRCGVATGRVFAIDNMYDDSRYNEPIIIPAFSKFTSSRFGNEKVLFTNPEPIIIPREEHEVKFKFIQGELVQLNIPNNRIKSYKLYLSSKNISDYHFYLEIDGMEWTQVDNAFLQTGGGQAYSVHRDAFDNVYLLFTYDYRKFISTDSVLKLEYVDTKGKFKCMSGYVDTPLFSIYAEDREVNKWLTFTNITPFEGGFDNEDLNLSKAKAISRARTPKFLCTLEDYYNAIFSYPGVLDVRCVDMSVRGATNIKPYELKAYVLVDGDSMGADYAADLQRYIYSMQDITRSVQILDPKVKEVIVKINFTIENENVNIIELENEILEYIRPELETTNFDKDLIREQLLLTIMNAFPELKTVDIESPSENLSPALGEVIKVIDIVVSGDYYGNL